MAQNVMHLPLKDTPIEEVMDEQRAQSMLLSNPGGTLLPQVSSFLSGKWGYLYPLVNCCNNFLYHVASLEEVLPVLISTSFQTDLVRFKAMFMTHARPV
jgi:hypothetical protein